MKRIPRFVGSAVALAVVVSAACSDDSGPSDGGGLHHPAGTITHSDTIGGRPFGVAVSAGGVVYVTQLDSAQLTRFNLAGQRVAKVPVGASPTDVTFSPDGGTAYDTDQGDNSITRITVPGNAFNGTRSFSSPTFRVRAVGSQLFVTDNAATLHVLDAATGAQQDSVPVGADPNGLAFDPGGSRLFVATFSGGTVDLVSRITFLVTGSYAVGGAPQDIALTPDGSELYIANVSGGVGVWNTTSGAVITTVPVSGSTFGLAMTPDGQQAWVSAPGNGMVFVINTATRALIDTVVTGGIPRRIAFSADGKVAVIANEMGWVDFVN